MKIFLTGASGFIGLTLLESLKREGHLTTSLLLPGERAEAVEAAGSRAVRGDVTRAQSLHGLMDGHDAVIHLAGAVGYGLSMRKAILINRDGTRNTAAAAASAGVRRFIHFSSVSVYGRVPDVFIREDFPRKKTGDPYGDTKIEAETALEEYTARGDLDCTILRPTVIYGPGDRLFLPKLAENIRSGRARVIGAGDNTVDLVHVDDIARCVTLVLKNARSIGETYNVTNPDNPPWAEFLSIVAGAMGVPAPRGRISFQTALAVAGAMQAVSKITGRPPRLTRYAVRVVGRQYHYITDKIRDQLGFKPTVDLKEGIREAITAAGYAPPPKQ